MIVRNIDAEIGADRGSEVAAFLKHAEAEPVGIEALAGGKNNRVFKLSLPRGAPMVLKVYHRSASDSRDRLHHEFAFSEYAWNLGLRALPQPIAASREAQAALYGFVEGQRLQAAPDTRAIAEVAAFLTGLNGERDCAAARNLPDGSEACFSVQSHLELIDARFQRLETAGFAVRSWLCDELEPFWRNLKVAIGRDASAAGIDLVRMLDPEQRILSPSDLGFHNVIRRTDGSLCFHDFEYAGWDDPAKLMGDFFNQIEVPVPLQYFVDLERALVQLGGKASEARWRLHAMLPAYAVKWSLIALNPFLPADAARREFAGQDLGSAQSQGLERARAQLRRAHDILQLERSLHG
jgi:hypothetical protein